MFTETLPAGQAGHRDPIHNDIAKTLNSAGVSVRHGTYNAVGNDTNDDTAEIQAAITAAPAGSTVILPPNPSGLAVYRTSSALTVTKPLRLLGYGSTVKNVGSGNVLEITSTSDVTVEGVTLDGNYPTRTTGRAVNVQSSSRVRLIGCRFQNIGALAVGFSGAGGCNHLWVLRCEFSNIRLAGLRLGEAGSGNIEHFWVEDNWLELCDLGDVNGQAGIQSHGQGGVAPAFEVRYGHITRNTLLNVFRVGLGLDYLTDSEVTGNTVVGSHTGEACALTGCRNTIVGNRFYDSTGAAGFLLWCVNQASQDNHDTVVADNIMAAVNAGAGSNQGIAIIAGGAGVTAKQILVTGNRCTGWNVGIQNYLGSGTNSLADDGTVLIRDNHLTGNSNAYSWASPFTPVLRGNLTAADTIDA